jgi:hypothetical protein
MAKHKISRERVDAVFEGMVNFLRNGEKRIVLSSLDRNVSHKFKCGTSAELLQISIDIDPRGGIYVLVTFNVGHAATEVQNLREAAEYVVRIFDESMICMECAQIYASSEESHRCEMKLMGIMMGSEDACCACFEQCSGTVVPECGHPMHLVCSRKVESCPLCRRTIALEVSD